MTAVRRPYLALVLCLIVQALLMTHRLDLLPMWNDELFTVQVAQHPVDRLLEAVRNDVHPPLYFLLAHYWIRIASGDVLIQLRLLSVVFTLLATMALDRLLLKHAPVPVRLWCLALWTCSACMLLYSRMARSYSLQVLVFVVVCWAAWRWSDEFASWKRLLLWAGALAALLYVHYVPGIAAWAGANFLLYRPGRARRLLAGNAVVLAAYLPWLAAFIPVVSMWQAKPSLLLLTNSLIFETAVKFGYGCYSFLFGEAIPVWMLPVTALLAIPVAWLFWIGVRTARTWLVPSLVAALIGFAGVAGWVSYAFAGARLLFLLPLVILAIAAGAFARPRGGTVIAGTLLAANLVGAASYFGARDLLNIGYLAPMNHVARDIAASSAPADTLVLVDGPNLSGVVLAFYLPGFATRQVYTPEDADAVRRELANPAIRHVWFLRHPHDVTPGRALERLETDLRRTWEGKLHPYVSFSPTHEVLMRAANMQVSSAWMYSSWEFQKPR